MPSTSTHQFVILLATWLLRKIRRIFQNSLFEIFLDQGDTGAGYRVILRETFAGDLRNEPSGRHGRFSLPLPFFPLSVSVALSFSLLLCLFHLSRISLELARKNFYSSSRWKITPRTKYCRVARFLFYAVLGLFIAVVLNPPIRIVWILCDSPLGYISRKGTIFRPEETTLLLRAKCIALEGARARKFYFCERISVHRAFDMFSAT